MSNLPMRPLICSGLIPGGKAANLELSLYFISMVLNSCLIASSSFFLPLFWISTLSRARLVVPSFFSVATSYTETLVIFLTTPLLVSFTLTLNTTRTSTACSAALVINSDSEPRPKYAIPGLTLPVFC